MLVVARRVGERIVLGDGVEVYVAKISRNEVRLAIRAPQHMPVYRGEVWDAIAAANRSAAEAGLEIESVAAQPPSAAAAPPTEPGSSPSGRGEP